jgi:hypothetical protein
MIDPIVTTLINFGIGGCMAALVVWHVWYTQTKQIPTLLTTFESQMGKEREAAAQRLTTERELSTLRHEDNIRQSALLLTSLRQVHHSLRNVSSLLSVLATKIDFVLGIKSKEEARVREEEIRKQMHQAEQEELDLEVDEMHSPGGHSV